MDKNYRINYRVPEIFRSKVEEIMTEKSCGDSEFMLMVLDKFFNPEIHYVDREVEVIKTVEKEVIKQVVIDSEGTVQGHSVSLSDALFAELSKLKYNPDTSMDSFVGDILWNRIQWSQNKKSSPTANGTHVNTATKETPMNVRAFEEFRQMKKDCETEDDWKELMEEIKEATTLTDKQKNLLINTTFR